MLRRIVLFSAAVMNLLLLDQIVKAVSVSSLRDRPLERQDLEKVVSNL